MGAGICHGNYIRGRADREVVDMELKAAYTGGAAGWGTLLYRCERCGQRIAEYECDSDGLPTNCLYDKEAEHVCPEEPGEPGGDYDG